MNNSTPEIGSQCCYICGEPPTSIGELFMAQFGAEGFLCGKCWKLHPRSGKGKGFKRAEIERGIRVSIRV
jgi:hypothetical protein